MRYKINGLRVFIRIGLFVTLMSILLYYGQDTFHRMNHPMKYTDIVEKYSEKYGLDKYLVYSVIKAESNFNANAVSHRNAKGLMQLMDATAKECAGRLSNDYAVELNGSDSLFDPETNVRLGTFYLSELIKRFDNVENAVAAYNAGPTNVAKWLNNSEYSDGHGNLTNIPFGETRRYVKNVFSSYEFYKRLYDVDNDNQ